MVGGALLLLGLFSRPIALLLTGNMLVAYWSADRPALLGVFRDLDAFLRADPFWFLFVSIVGPHARPRRGLARPAPDEVVEGPPAPLTVASKN
jgi:hypothetical protein